MKSSSYSGFFKLTTDERMKEVAEFTGITEDEQKTLQDPGSLDMETADNMVENVIGRFSLPMGVAVNFIINDKEYVIPMVTEEPSVIAAASNAAKTARASGGFFASNTGTVMISQIQLTGIDDPEYAKIIIEEHKDKIIEICNEKDPTLVKFGGGGLGAD